MYQEKDGEVRLQGLPVSPGLAVSRVCLFNDRRHDSLSAAPSSSDPARELAALDEAVASALGQLASLSHDVADRIGPAEAGIFSAQAMILEDAVLLDKIRAAIRDGQSAAKAITQVLDEYEARLLALDNEYIRDRASDIGEIKRRLLDVLGDVRPSLKCAGQAHCRKGYDRIIVAEELTPSLTLELDSRHVRAFVTERGGQTSHAAILARALGIPAVTGLRGIHQALACGTELLVDGQTGEIVVWPSAATLGALRAVAPAATASEPPVPALRVQANITTAADTAAALEARAEGVGLYRTEFEFFAANRLLDEDEQYDLYLSVLHAMPDQTVTFRLLDVGGDKSAGFFEIEAEQNPYLGLRGSRLLLARPQLWRSQARALARAAAHGPVQVMGNAGSAFRLPAGPGIAGGGRFCQCRHERFDTVPFRG
ncbi:MAG: hypothetical protein LC725_07490 [Lentisphaerae bacterium]|nr:hypothetical protein [Lentisphaerota bacterium]